MQLLLGLAGRLHKKCFILFVENRSSSSLEVVRSFELCWNDRAEVYFGSELRQNVAECLTRDSHRVQSMGHSSQSAYQKH